MNNSGIILTLAYPETIVRVSDEKWVGRLHYLGIGKKNFVRAGHAALVLIHKTTKSLEYFDFGRYTTPQGYGRVRGKETDCELDFPITAKVENGKLANLDEILKFLATNPKLTHGEGKMIASECDQINYEKAKEFIENLQNEGLVKYAAFSKKASNCSRFVTDTLIASVNNRKIKQKLKRSNSFTPSTIGNVVKARTVGKIYEVSEGGKISNFNAWVKKMNANYFLDNLNGFEPNLEGNLKPKIVEGVSKNAQWLEGIGAGAWFELKSTLIENEYKFRRVSPYGNIDVDALFSTTEKGFNYSKPYRFVHYSNCKFFHIKQNEKVYRFERKV